MPDEEVKKSNKKNFFVKLKKAVENQEEEILNLIEDYEVDKESDDEIVIDGDVSDISDENSESDKEVEDKKEEDEQLDTNDPAVRRLKWVKKEFKSEKIEEIKKKRENESKKDDYIRKLEERLENIDKKVALEDTEIAAEYSKKVLQLGQQNKPFEELERIEYLIYSAKDKGLKLKLYILILSNYFEIFQSQFQEIPITVWRKIYEHLKKLYILAEEVFTETQNGVEYINFDLKEETSSKANKKAGAAKKMTWDDDFDNTAASASTNAVENTESAQSKIKENQAINLFQGSIVSFLDKLQQETYKLLQFNECGSSDFIEILKDEIKLINICLAYMNHSAVINSTEAEQIKSKISIVITQHLYYRKENQIELIIKNYTLFQKNIDEELSKAFDFKYSPSTIKNIRDISVPRELIDFLFNSILLVQDNKSKVKAVLLQIYFYSLNNDYINANNLFHKSNLAQLVNLTKDSQAKVFYNRALIQLGLCAFRHADFEVAKYYLSPLCCLGSSRLRDNLCQTNEKISVLEKEERRKLIPFTIGINLEEIESTFYLTLLIEDLDKVLLQRLGMYKGNLFLKKQLESYEKQVSAVI